MNPHAPAGEPDRGPAPRSGWPHRRPLALALAAVAFAALVVALAAVARGIPGRASTAHQVSVSAALVRTVELRGVPGRVVIVGADTDRVTLTGQLHWTGHAPVSSSGLSHATGVLSLTYQCAAGSPCDEHYRLVVPWHTAVILHQPSGQVIVSGLAGALQIIASSVDVSATGLRSPSLTATITSGHLSATFDLPPRHVGVTLSSAQATLRLPASTAYAVSSQVTAGYVRVAVPRDSTAARTVTDRIVSGELELLPRGPAGPP
jgi:hypothetical protein